MSPKIRGRGSVIVGFPAIFTKGLSVIYSACLSMVSKFGLKDDIFSMGFKSV
jgi:hypothetical protein